MASPSTARAGKTLDQAGQWWRHHRTRPFTCPDTGSELWGKGQARKTTFLSGTPTLPNPSPPRLFRLHLSSLTSQVRKLRPQEGTHKGASQVGTRGSQEEAQRGLEAEGNCRATRPPPLCRPALPRPHSPICTGRGSRNRQSGYLCPKDWPLGLGSCV